MSEFNTGDVVVMISKAELEQLRAHDKEATDLTIDQQVEIGRLRTALSRFGRHLPGCSYFRDGAHQASPDTVCDCGLVAAGA